MFNVIFLIWYFLTLAIMIVAFLIFSIIENFKELKRLNSEIKILEKKLMNYKAEHKKNEELIEILNDTILSLKK